MATRCELITTATRKEVSHCSRGTNTRAAGQTTLWCLSLSLPSTWMSRKRRRMLTGTARRRRRLAVIRQVDDDDDDVPPPSLVSCRLTRPMISFRYVTRGSFAFGLPLSTVMHCQCVTYRDRVCHGRRRAISDKSVSPRLHVT